MKAIWEFDLSNPQDIMEHRRMLKAADMSIVLFEITRNLQKRIQDKGTVDSVFAAINELMETYNIDLEEIIE